MTYLQPLRRNILSNALFISFWCKKLVTIEVNHEVVCSLSDNTNTVKDIW